MLLLHGHHYMSVISPPGLYRPGCHQYRFLALLAFTDLKCHQRRLALLAIDLKCHQRRLALLATDLKCRLRRLALLDFTDWNAACAG